jgi:hypothetical protein
MGIAMKIESTLRIVLLLATGCTLLVGCDKGGIYPLLDRTDILVPCGASSTTWVASTDLGTEIFLIGATDPSVPLAPGTRGCFAHGFVEHDSSTTYASGTYSLDAAGHGNFEYETSYLFDYQPSRSVLSRDGSIATLHDVPVVESLVITGAAPQLLVTLNGTQRRLTNVYDLVDSIDTSTQQGGEDLFVLLNLPLFTSQVRLVGFGSGRMTRYVNSATFFQGAIAVMAPDRNEFSVKVESFTSPNTDIRYYTFSDFAGITIDGLQETNVSTAANGSMTGTLTWSMRDGAAATDVAYEGTIDYSDIDIGNGHASGGTFGLAITSPTPRTFSVPYTRANDVDLRASLPVEP